MTTAEVVVTLAGLALIGLVNWWFFGGVKGQRSKVEVNGSTFDVRPSTTHHDH